MFFITCFSINIDTTISIIEIIAIMPDTILLEKNAINPNKINTEIPIVANLLKIFNLFQKFIQLL